MKEELLKILEGIDQTERDHPEGWWETSTGAEFGEGILKKIDDLFEKYHVTPIGKEFNFAPYREPVLIKIIPLVNQDYYIRGQIYTHRVEYKEGYGFYEEPHEFSIFDLTGCVATNALSPVYLPLTEGDRLALFSHNGDGVEMLQDIEIAKDMTVINVW